MDAFLLLALTAGLLFLAWLATLRWALGMRRRVATERGRAQSIATRHGQIHEQLLPVTAWPWDAKGFRFLGSPVDGIQFNEDGVVFVEIKTAGSRLSPVQRSIRDHVTAGRVTWQEIRL